MKVFLQNPRTQEFYAGEGRWVTTKETARDCGSSLRAQELALRDNLTAVSIVLTFAQAEHTIVIPLRMPGEPPIAPPNP